MANDSSEAPSGRWASINASGTVSLFDGCVLVLKCRLHDAKGTGRVGLRRLGVAFPSDDPVTLERDPPVKGIAAIWHNPSVTGISHLGVYDGEGVEICAFPTDDEHLVRCIIEYLGIWNVRRHSSRPSPGTLPPRTIYGTMGCVIS